MPKVEFYHQYSELDKHHEFAIVEAGCGIAYHTWVFFYLGMYGIKKDIYLLPYKPYNWGNPVKTYKINGADKVARLIADRINYYLQTK